MLPLSPTLRFVPRTSYFILHISYFVLHISYFKLKSHVYYFSLRCRSKAGRQDAQALPQVPELDSEFGF